MIGKRRVLLATALFALGCGSDGDNNAANNANNVNNTTNNTTNNANNTNNQNNVVVESGLDERPANPDCVAPDRPDGTISVTSQEVFTDHPFVGIVDFAQAPNGNWYLATQRGDIVEIESPTAPGRRVWLSIRALTNATTPEGGIRGIAFHPDFIRTGFIYISFYTLVNNAPHLVVSRFAANEGAVADVQSEKRIIEIEQPFVNNNGGGLTFGPDGYLYVGVGDGGTNDPMVADPNDNAQNKNNLLGSVIRIDVDNGDPYAVPADNPFASGGGAPEVFAYGFQNPQRISFDSATGDLWVADPGLENSEEISRVNRGGNYGWPIKEGKRCLNLPLCEVGEWIDPLFDYGHAAGDTEIRGGFIYRGSAIPSLVGHYVYGDNTSGKIWALVYDQWGVPSSQLLLETGLDISTFFEGDDGELFYASGTLGIFQLTDSGSSTADYPTLLSETGCVDPSDPTIAASGMVPFAPNAPFWSDNAEKERYVAIPDGDQITISPSGDWELPNGGVTMKHFKLGERYVETRFFVRHNDGSYSGYTYEWNDEGTDATLLKSSKTKDLGDQTWRYPSRSDCMECHTESAGASLGLESRQMDGLFDYAATDRRANKLDTFIKIGYVEDPGERKTPMPDPFGTEGTLDDRARAYLHTNCSSCHRSANDIGRVDFDVTFDGFLEELCNNPNSAGDLGVAAAGRLVPGEPDRSMILHRMGREDAYRMPLGSAVIDDPGVALIEEWISELTECP